MTFLFVHGTGVREAAFDATLAAIRRNLGDNTTVEGCYWADEAGARLNANGASIPDYAEARGFENVLATEQETVDQEALEVALWSQLTKDPWWELRVVSAQGQNPDEAGPGPRDSGITSFLLERAAILASRQVRHSSNCDFAENADRLSTACQLIAGSDICARCGSLHLTPEGRALIGRAVVATGIWMAEEAGAVFIAALDPDLRDRLVELAAGDSLGQDRGLFAPVTGTLRNVVLRPLVGLAANVGSRLATSYGRRKRGLISDSSVAGIGDILVYQANGHKVRSTIESAIDRIEGSVALLAHSLGGIACLELLIEKPIEKVSALITIGSQAPFFYEIGALQALPFRADLPSDQRLPAQFPAWLNIYDPRDFLSYIAEPLFATSRVSDVPVNNRLAFPAAHSGYWFNADVWQAIHSFLASR